MKKTFAILAVAMMMFATGCGKNTPPAAPPENKPDAAVEQVKEKVDQAKEKVDEAKENATQAAANIKENAQLMLDNAKDLMAKVKDNTADKTAIALGGIVPGINIETVTEMLGEPVDNDGTNFAYSNGIDVKAKDKIVQEVSTTYTGLNTPGAAVVGMAEDALKAVYGDAMTVTKKDDGSSVYKFVDKDSLRAIEFTTKDGKVIKISANLNK